MYWKYHLESGDLAQFKYEHEDHGHMRPWGTVLQFNAQYDIPDEPTAEDIEFDRIQVKIKSGKQEVWVTMDDLIQRIKEEDRGTDLPRMSEEFRLSKGIDQIARDRRKAKEEA